MNRIILLETSVSLCSAALAEDGKLVAYKECPEPRAHASQAAPLVKALLDERGLKVKDCDAVCLSKGPGSYTSLRVGSSTAKGLCFGSNLKLLAAGTLDILVNQAIDEGLVDADTKFIVPMIDARRMEVYSAVFTPQGKQITETAPVIVDENSFSAQLAEGKVLFIGDGAGKCEGVIRNANARFIQTEPKASGMIRPALEAWNEKRFEDIAYFEPFYLKQFVATVSKNNILEDAVKKASK